MPRDYRLATERGHSDYDEDMLDREEPIDTEVEDTDDDALALAIRAARANVEAAHALLYGLRAQQDGDREEADRGLAEHMKQKARVNKLAAQLGGDEYG